MKQTEIEQIYHKVMQGGVSIDTRLLRPGEVFINITAEEKYNIQAVDLGASMIVWKQKRNVQKGVETLKVKDPIEALQRVARHHREQLSCRVIVICGSNGKTSLKNWLYHQLRLHQAVYCKKNNYNNDLGVPLCILEIRSYHQIALLEVGIRHLGEHKRLLELIQPSEVITTNYGLDHLGVLGENHKKAYNEVQDYCQEHKVPNSIVLEHRQKEKTVHSYIRSRSQSVIRERALGKVPEARLLDRIISRELEGLRGSWVYLKQKTIYLDCYNANPSSYKFSLSHHPERHKSWVYIMGHMADLGVYTGKYHQELYNWIKMSLNLEEVYFIGSNWERVVKEDNRVWSLRELQKRVAQLQYKYIYIKGSRELYLENIITIPEEV